MVMLFILSSHVTVSFVELSLSLLVLTKDLKEPIDLFIWNFYSIPQEIKSLVIWDIINNNKTVLWDVKLCPSVRRFITEFKQY